MSADGTFGLAGGGPNPGGRSFPRPGMSADGGTFCDEGPPPANGPNGGSDPLAAGGASGCPFGMGIISLRDGVGGYVAAFGSGNVGSGLPCPLSISRPVGGDEAEGLAVGGGTVPWRSSGEVRIASRMEPVPPDSAGAGGDVTGGSNSP